MAWQYCRRMGIGVAAVIDQRAALLRADAAWVDVPLYAPADGVVDALHVQVGDTVESKDLLVRLRA